MIDALIFSIPVDNDVSVMEHSSGFLEFYLSERIFLTEILVFKVMESFPDVIAE